MVVGGQFAWPVGSAPPSPSARDNSAKSRLVRSTRSSRASRSPTQGLQVCPLFHPTDAAERLGISSWGNREHHRKNAVAV